MAVEQELTPEEKLLQVIQKGEPKKVSAAPMAGAVPSEGAGPESSALLSGAPAAGRGLLLLNRLLAAAAVVFVLLAGYETYRNFPTQAVAYPEDTLVVEAAPALLVAAPSLSDTKDLFAQRRIFGPAPKTDLPGNTPTNTSPVVGWRAYGRENLSLMGMSDVKRMEDGVEQVRREAIIIDNKLKKMYFLTQGKVLMLADQEVTVARIEENLVELRAGEEVLNIE